jgi:hypothetical protein
MQAQAAPLLAPGRMGRQHRTSAFALLVVLGMALLWFTGDTNADWTAYEILFEEEGGWLALANRDPAFLWLLSAGAGVLAYPDFRLALGLAFLFFTWRLVRRWARVAVVDTPLLSYLVLLPLLLPRVTVQIREGVAVLFVLWALMLLANPVRRGIVGPLALLLVAASVHAGSAVFAVLLLAPLVFRFVFGRASQAAAVLLVALAAVAVLMLGPMLAGDVVFELGEAVWGGYASLNVDAGADKALYWLARCACAAYLVVLVRRVAPVVPVRLAGFLRLGGYVVVSALHLLVLYLVLTGSNAYVTSAASRALNLVFLTLFAVVGMHSRKTLALQVVAILLLADQVRVLLDNAPGV